MKRLCAVLAILVLGAVGGVLGQAAGAEAGAAHLRTVTSDKTLYAGHEANINSIANGPTFDEKTLMTIRVTAPSAGTAAIAFDTAVFSPFDDNSGSTDTETNDMIIENCDRRATRTNIPRCHALNTFWMEQPPGANGDVTEPYSQGMLEHFAARGSRTSYITVIADNWSCGFRGHLHAQVLFTPSHPIATSSHVSITTGT